MNKPKLQKFSHFLRNCKIEKKYEINNYFLIYLFCRNKELIVVECDKQNNCIETVKVELQEFL